MNRKSIRIAFTALMAFSLLMVNVCLVYADAAADWYNQTSADYTIEVAAPDGYVNIRSGPGTDYDILTSAKNGVVLSVYAESSASNGKTWGQVSYNGYYGWLSLTQVKKVSSSQSNSQSNQSENNSQNESGKLIHTLYSGGTDVYKNVTVSAPDGGVNLRYGPGTEYAIIHSMIPNNTSLHVSKEAYASNGKKWGLVTYEGASGWIFLPQTTEIVQKESDQLINTLYSGGTAISRNVKVSAPDGGVNLRYGPGTEYAIIHSMIPNNTSLHVSKKAYASNGKEWGLVTYEGASGWIFLPQTTEITQKAVPSDSQPQTGSQQTIIVEAEANGGQPANIEQEPEPEPEYTDSDRDSSDTKASSRSLFGFDKSFVIFALLALSAVMMAVLAIILILVNVNHRNRY